MRSESPRENGAVWYTYFAATSSCLTAGAGWKRYVRASEGKLQYGGLPQH